jgi:hypothetical protein
MEKKRKIEYLPLTLLDCLSTSNIVVRSHVKQKRVRLPELRADEGRLADSTHVGKGRQPSAHLKNIPGCVSALKFPLYLQVLELSSNRIWPR